MDPNAEWIEADGLGGFANGTVSGIRTRRYHALLLTATRPPAGRVVLVNGFDLWVETSQARFALSSQRYAPDVVDPDGASRIESFDYDPWPRWRFRLSDELEIEQELFVRPNESMIYLSWRASARSAAGTILRVRPFFSGRDFHSLQHKDEAFRFEAEEAGEEVVWQIYDGLPAIVARSNGRFVRQADWYRNFLYTEELKRGLDAAEDLATPGFFEFDLSAGIAVLTFAARGHAYESDEPVGRRYATARAAEKHRRKKFPTPLHRAADAYLVRRGEGKTIIAGYPWFGDWGRDTFISIRGLCIASDRLQDAAEILLEWANLISEGMLPNRLPDQGNEPEYNSVDASLWYVIAVGDYLRALERKEDRARNSHRDELRNAVEAILTGYQNGTRYGIRRDDDGLLRAGERGYQLTWMDARVEGHEITPRIGKPVEVQALWLNALAIAGEFSPRWRALFESSRATFIERFWNSGGPYLYDVVDCDHQAGTADATFRPNQIFAVGGLPLMLLPNEQSRQVVDAVEARLLTPLGLRSLAPDEPGYVGHYAGSVAHRDGCYHQGTAWPWLLGAFVEAWVRVRGNSEEAKRAAVTRFVMPLIEHLHHAGLGHISEIADGDPPHTPAGCPFQAWSLGELLRLDSIL